MDKSKRTFYIIAAIAIVAVILIFAFRLGKDDPKPTEPTGTAAPTGVTTVPTVPTVSEPNTDETLPIFPTEPSETSPQQGFKPDEGGEGETPVSNGAHYMNVWPVSLNVNYYLSDQLLLVSFGRSEEGLSNYLYLTPSVELVSGNGKLGKNFQFVFTPSAGYVTTITEKELGDHGGYTTFSRAQDYGLPAVYESESSPGTVWFMTEDTKITEYIHIDVKVYYSHRLLATLRIYVSQDMEGSYYMLGIENLNQLEQSAFYMVKRYEMEDRHLTALMDLTKQYAGDDKAQHKYGYDPSTLTEKDFVIEWRAAGQGTYFDYVSALASDKELTPAALYADTPIVAVSIRDNGRIYHPAPMTYYYRILEGAGENGETVYELIGVDSVDHYYLRGLYYSEYPGYSETEE